jgi:hypothetical protein
MYFPIEDDRPLAFEHVIKFGRSLVIMLPCAVDVHGMYPGGHVMVLPADQQVAPAAGAALPGGLTFVTDQGGSR